MYDNRKRLILLLILIAFIFSIFTVYIYSAGSLSLSARSAVLYQPDTNSFLYEKNPDERLSMASTTKIMTAVIALETLSADEIITPDKRALGIEGSSIYIKEGETFFAYDLIYALILSSANDAAEALAYRISGSIEAFAEKMNEKAAEIGAKNTHFNNPHGLDSVGHYTTARDLALISAYALKNEVLKEITSTKRKTIESNLTKRVLVNHNKLLSSYDGCIGMKTGYTKKSGRSLVSAAERDGLTFVAVTINAPDDWLDHTKMLNYGYATLARYVLCKRGDFTREISVIGAKSEKVTVYNKEGLTLILPKGEKIYSEMILPRYVIAPTNADTPIGTVIFKCSGEIIAKVFLYPEISIDKKHNFFNFM